VATKYLLAVLAVLFLAMSAFGAARGGVQPQKRTWLIIAVIFGAVSAWLFYQG